MRVCINRPWDVNVRVCIHRPWDVNVDAAPWRQRTPACGDARAHMPRRRRHRQRHARPAPHGRGSAMLFASAHRATQRMVKRANAALGVSGSARSQGGWAGQVDCQCGVPLCMTAASAGSAPRECASAQRQLSSAWHACACHAWHPLCMKSSRIRLLASRRPGVSRFTELPATASAAALLCSRRARDPIQRRT
eukprot:350444-Chlamydomonas_euryale.AAC.1